MLLAAALPIPFAAAQCEGLGETIQSGDLYSARRAALANALRMGRPQRAAP